MERVNFSEIFKEIYMNHGKSLEELRKTVLIKNIFTIIVMIALIVFVFNCFSDKYWYLSIALFGIISIGGYLIRFNSVKYRKIFKERAIKDLIEERNYTYQYAPTTGISPLEYDKSEFDNGHDKFLSEDYIVGDIDEMASFKMSQVRTIEEKNYSRHIGESRVNKITTFYGVYGEIELPIIPMGRIDICKKMFSFTSKKHEVRIDNEEFEKHYTVLADDMGWATKVVTPEVADALLEIRKFFRKPIQIKFKRNKIYFRLECGDILEPPKLSNAVEFDTFLKYYRIVDLPRYIYSIFAENLARSGGDRKFEEYIKMSKLTEIEKFKLSEKQKREDEMNRFSVKDLKNTNK